MWTRLSSASGGGVAYCGSKIQMTKWTFALGDRQKNDGMRIVVLVGQETLRVFS
jgi:hypothetical protein